MNHCVEDGLEEGSGDGGFGGIGSVCELPWSSFSSSDYTTGIEVLGSSVFTDGWTMSSPEISAYWDSESEEVCL